MIEKSWSENRWHNLRNICVLSRFSIKGKRRMHDVYCECRSIVAQLFFLSSSLSLCLFPFSTDTKWCSLSLYVSLMCVLFIGSSVFINSRRINVLFAHSVSNVLLPLNQCRRQRNVFCGKGNETLSGAFFFRFFGYWFCGAFDCYKPPNWCCDNKLHHVFVGFLIQCVVYFPFSELRCTKVKL